MLFRSWLMLRRSLLYTAVTRAKRIVVLVGSRRALAKAVHTQGAGRRYTALSDRLRPGRAGRSQQPAGPSAGLLQPVPVEPEQRALRSR